MKRFRIIVLLTMTSLLSSSLTAGAVRNPAHYTGDDFSVKEYEEFHRVLHPLEHEALPRKDFQRIRSNAGELVKRGESIVEVGVPPGTVAKYVEEIRRS